MSWFLCQYQHFPIIFIQATAKILEKKKISQTLPLPCFLFLFLESRTKLHFEYAFTELFFPALFSYSLDHMENIYVCFSEVKKHVLSSFHISPSHVFLTHRPQNWKQASRAKEVLFLRLSKPWTTLYAHRDTQIGRHNFLKCFHAHLPLSLSSKCKITQRNRQQCLNPKL